MIGPPPSKPGSKTDGGDLKQTRRRLSVMSDNKLIEGMDGVNLDEEQEQVGGASVSSYSSSLKKSAANSPFFVTNEFR